MYAMLSVCSKTAQHAVVSYACRCSLGHGALKTVLPRHNPQSDTLGNVKCRIWSCQACVCAYRSQREDGLLQVLVLCLQLPATGLVLGNPVFNKC